MNALVSQEWGHWVHFPNEGFGRGHWVQLVLESPFYYYLPRSMGWGHEGGLCLDLDSKLQEEMPFKCPLLVILLFTVYRMLFNLSCRHVLCVVQVFLCWSFTVCLKHTGMPSLFFILYKAYYSPGKMCYFQKTEIRKLHKNGWHYEKTKVMFGLSTPKNHKETPNYQNKINQNQKFVAQCSCTLVFLEWISSKNYNRFLNQC